MAWWRLKTQAERPSSCVADLSSAVDKEMRLIMEAYQHCNAGGGNGDGMSAKPASSAVSLDPADARPDLHEEEQILAQALEGYRLVELCAQGGQGTIYKAWHEQKQRMVAIKVVRSGMAHNARRIRF